MDAMIGIKIADGTFFPILQESEKRKKRVILTTVKDEQPAVQIDLYRGEGEEMKGASYVGSLMINNIAPAPSGDPEIELLMGIDEKGNLASTARDMKSKEEQSLSVGLESLPPEETYDMPDFEVTESEDEAPSPKREKDDSYETPYFSYNDAPSRAEETEKSRKPLLVIAVIGILVVAACGVLHLLLPRRQGRERERLENRLGGSGKEA
jgi:molecular chaperone DnaK (HSP70)